MNRVFTFFCDFWHNKHHNYGKLIQEVSERGQYEKYENNWNVV